MVNLSPDALSRGVNRLWTPKTLFESRPHIRVKYEPHTPTDHGFRIHGVQSDPEMYVSSPTGDPSHISPSIHAPSRDSYANIHHFGGYSSGLDVGYNSVAGMEGLGTRPPNRLDETANAFSDFSEDFTSTRDGYSSEDSTLDPVAYSGETSGTPPNPSINGSLNHPTDTNESASPSPASFINGTPASPPEDPVYSGRAGTFTEDLDGYHMAPGEYRWVSRRTPGRTALALRGISSTSRAVPYPRAFGLVRLSGDSPLPLTPPLSQSYSASPGTVERERPPRQHLPRSTVSGTESPQEQQAQQQQVRHQDAHHQEIQHQETGHAQQQEAETQPSISQADQQGPSQPLQQHTAAPPAIHAQVDESAEPIEARFRKMDIIHRIPWWFKRTFRRLSNL